MSTGIPPPSIPAPKKRRSTFRPFKSPSTSIVKSDWLALSILAAKTAKDAGELAPFPYIKGACGMVVSLLEAVEKVQKNQEDLKDLCENIDEIVGILRDQISTHGNTAAVKLMVQCEEFERFLGDMLRTVEKMQKPSYFRQFIKSSTIAAEIAGYEKRIDGLLSRINV
ncbi:hypothetical protein C8F04DRAFT_1186335 [Mycena alexandri]|uniref:Uncharacterized protein n=1 Tax=Mycena alexandri TaxID=1745969 RepID=A0AAD6SSN8_9AGAR|nr:hypothetical protein C8F04DRAFT_1186335 [Mycena alexandri]